MHKCCYCEDVRPVVLNWLREKWRLVASSQISQFRCQRYDDSTRFKIQFMHNCRTKQIMKSHSARTIRNATIINQLFWQSKSIHFSLAKIHDSCGILSARETIKRNGKMKNSIYIFKRKVAEKNSCGTEFEWSASNDAYRKIWIDTPNAPLTRRNVNLGEKRMLIILLKLDNMLCQWIFKWNPLRWTDEMRDDDDVLNGRWKSLLRNSLIFRNSE